MRAPRRGMRFLGTASFIGNRLRYCVGPIKKEDRHLLVGGPAQVRRTVYLISGRVPFGLSGDYFDSIGFSPASVLNRQCLTAYNHGYPMKRIDVPRCGHARFENQPSDQSTATLADGLNHGRCPMCARVERRARRHAVGVEDMIAGRLTTDCRGAEYVMRPHVQCSKWQEATLPAEPDRLRVGRRGCCIRPSTGCERA
jgi:hypothetical protein